MEPLQVLFVCTGNICRSPAAERLAAYAWNGLPVDFGSAGTRAVTGAGIHARTALALERRGVSSSGHVARDLSEDLVRDADLVLTMTRSHRSDVVRLQPAAVSRTFTLTEAARLSVAVQGRAATAREWVEAMAAGRHAPTAAGADDITDPIRLPREGHADVVAQIQESVKRLLAGFPGRT